MRINHKGYEVSILNNAKRGSTIILNNECRRDISKRDLELPCIRKLVHDYEIVSCISREQNLLEKVTYIKQSRRR